MARFTLSLALMSLVAAQGHAGSIVNGNFELGNTGFTTDYKYVTVDGPTGEYTVGTDPHLFHPLAPSFGDHTTGHGLMMIINGSTTPDQTVWQETVSVDAGTSYTFSGWVATIVGINGGVDPSPARFRFFVNGSQVGSDFSPIAAHGQWSQFKASWNSGPDASATIRIVDENTASLGNDSALDDFSLSGVPEPPSSVLVLVGLSSLILWRQIARTR
jgi:hypothetical protein